MSDETTRTPAGQQASGRLRLRYTALSDVGRMRKDNQDSGYAGEHFLAVADGVGGAARGDVASSTAIGELRALDVPPGNDLQGVLAEAIDRSHHAIADLVEQHPEIDGTSTTVTAAIFDGTRLVVGHVGDSRGYLLRGDEIHQVTKDHTFVQSLVDEGRITEDESRVHPHRHLILRAVDGVHETNPDLFDVELEPGDRILLCSDGVNASLDNQQIGTVLGQGTIEHAAVELIREALDAGSSDNVTVVLADVVDIDAVDAQETAPVALGPIVVGAAAEKRRGLSSVGGRRLRAMKRSDTGELDPIPAEAAGATVADVDPEEIRYAPRPPRRFGWLRRIAVVAVVVVLLYLGGAASYAWTQRQYYVAPAGQNVAIYQGVNADLPLIRLHSVYRASTVPVSSLPDFNERQVRDGMGARNLNDAQAIVDRLRNAAACESSTPTSTPSPTATPTRTPSRTPSRKATGKVTGGATGKATRGATSRATGKATSRATGKATSRPIGKATSTRSRTSSPSASPDPSASATPGGASSACDAP